MVRMHFSLGQMLGGPVPYSTPMPWYRSTDKNCWKCGSPVDWDIRARRYVCPLCGYTYTEDWAIEHGWK